MTSREDTLKFLVDVQVRNSAALKQLTAEMEELQARMDHRCEMLEDARQYLRSDPMRSPRDP